MLLTAKRLSDSPGVPQRGSRCALAAPRKRPDGAPAATWRGGRAPLFVLGELDKAVTDGRYPVAPTLLGLIDRSAAVRWRDEFYDQTYGVSRS